MANRLLSDHFSEPLDGATTAKIEIDSDTGNLTVDTFVDGDPASGRLASGTLEYFEKQGPPTRSVSADNGRAILALKGTGAGRPWFRFPWAACNGATEWQIHLNPGVRSEIMAHSGGGNVKLNLAGMAITRLWADTGGGNMDVVLPDNAANLDVTAKTGGGNVTVEIGRGLKSVNAVSASSGAGNVAVCVPSGIAARVYASSGLGKVTVDPRFGKIDKNTYQSPDFDSATSRVEITVKSGAGNVSVSTR